MAAASPDLPPPGPITAADAKRLTAQIRRQLGDVQSRSERLADMVRRAHAGRVWAGLGYASWDAWLRAEFPDLTRGQKYRLVAWGEVVGELEAAAGGPVEVSARQATAARRAGPSRVADRVRESLAGNANPTVEDRRAAVASALSDPIEATATPVAPPAPPAEGLLPRARAEATAPSTAPPRVPAGKTSAGSLLAALLAVEPSEAVDVLPVDLDRLQAWTGLVRAALRRQGAVPPVVAPPPPVGVSAPRSTPTAVPAAAVSPPAATVEAQPDVAASPRPAGAARREAARAGCAHPPNRRLGQTCMACGTKVP